jgi:Phosphoribosyl transferase domain
MPTSCAGAALPLAAVVAALQPVGHAGFGGRQADRRSGRLLGAEAGAPDGKPGRAAARNVRGAFKVDQKLRPRIKGKELVLVDDVITTGATAEACARALKRAGATRVDVLALARAVEPAAFVL